MEKTSSYLKFPDIQSQNYIIIDADSGLVIAAQNSEEKCYPASLTTLMTALLVSENCNMTDTITISSNAVSSVKYGDASAALKKDEEFTIEQALNIMLIKSANDMAYALGEHVGGSIANFANMMNKKAEELGCINTHFVNAGGLSNVNHYTCAYDMSLICRQVIDNPVIMNALSYEKTYYVEPTNKTSEARYYRLLHSMINGDYKYEYCIGGKTGYTEASGHTLATFAQKDGLRLICIVFNSTDTARYEDTYNLFEYVFNEFHRINVAESEDSFSLNQGQGLSLFDVKGKALKGNFDMNFSISESSYLLIPNGVKFDELSRKIIYNETEQNENEFASIEYYYNDNFVGSAKIILPNANGSDSIALSGLPYRQPIVSASADTSSLIINGSFFNINLWLVVGFICIILLITILLITTRRKQHPLRFK